MNAASIVTWDIVSFIFFKSVWLLRNPKHQEPWLLVFFGYIFGLALFKSVLHTTRRRYFNTELHAPVWTRALNFDDSNN